MPARQQSAASDETMAVPSRASGEVFSSCRSNTVFGVPGPSDGRSVSSKLVISRGRHKTGFGMKKDIVSRNRVAAVDVDFTLT